MTKHQMPLSQDAECTAPKASFYFRKPYLFMLGFLCLFYISLPSSAQKQRPANEVIVERLNSLERENQRLREDISDLKSENDELKLKDKDLEASLKEYEPFKFWAWILGGLGITSILGLAWLYIRVIPGKINHQVNARISQILNDRRDDFLALLKNYDFEKAVKQRHRIILLSHRNGSDDYPYRMLCNNGFQVTPFTRLEQLEEAQFTPQDIIVINNNGNYWTPEQVQTFINSQPNYCFYFGKGMINAQADRQYRFAAANIPTQFIGNLMNVLKYSHNQN